MLGFATSPRFVEHITGRHHPERPDRIRAIFQAVREAGLVDSPNPFNDRSLDLHLYPSGEKVVEIEPKPADPKWLALCHTPRHVELVRHYCEVGGGVLDQGDTPVCEASYEIALLSLGSLLTCCDAVMSGQVLRAFSAARPPGHHAEPDAPMGFCLFSNVAIAARYLQRQHGVGKVAIVDFDVHHGNGTQACLQEDPSVLFVSLHQHPRTCYPGSGYPSETGVGAGEGFTMNFTFDPGTEDAKYLRTFDNHVIPALDQFRPEMLLVSAGFDAHRDDPLANLNLSDECFEQITRRLVAVAARHCRGRVISALEGGYNLRALGRSIVRHLIGMM